MILPLLTNSTYLIVAFLFILLLAVIVLGVLQACGIIGGLKSKARRTGDGQHGDARWITAGEKKSAYPPIDYTPELWRKGENLPPKDMQGIIIGIERKTFIDDILEEITKGRYKKYNISAFVERGDVHIGMYAGSGAGKTAFFLYPNLEYACATGVSFFTTDTKGDLYRNYGFIAKEYYGYNVSVLDLRNPIISNGNNLLAQVNKYMDIYLSAAASSEDRLSAKAKSEKYARLIADNIINSDRNTNYGANAFFYDAANGLLTATILLVSEFGNENERHIASVFTLLTELLEQVPIGIGERTELRYNGIIRNLPVEHRAKLFATAAVQGAESTKMSVVTTALTKLINFIDSEIEQMLCFENDIDIEKFCKEKSAVFVVLPEEDTTKYFLVSLLIQQFYRECLIYADSLGGKLPNRAVFFLEEIGTVPKIEGFDLMFSASRSRNIMLVPLMQAPSQMEDKYGERTAETINGNLACVLYGGFSPESDLAKEVSEALGTVTVQTASVSSSADEPLHASSVQRSLTAKPLISVSELNRLPQGTFIVRRSGQFPMKSKLELFLNWGITIPAHYLPKPKELRQVYYLRANELEKRILDKYCCDTGEAAPAEKAVKKKKKVPASQDSNYFVASDTIRAAVHPATTDSEVQEVPPKPKKRSTKQETNFVAD